MKKQHKYSVNGFVFYGMKFTKLDALGVTAIGVLFVAYSYVTNLI